MVVSDHAMVEFRLQRLEVIANQWGENEFWEGLSTREKWVIGLAAFLAAMYLGQTVSAMIGVSDHWAATTDVMSFVGTTLTAWIAWKTYNAADVAAKIARRAVNADRAWVVVQKPKGEIGAETSVLGALLGPSLRIEIPIKNFGQSPALRVVVNVRKQVADLTNFEPLEYPDNGSLRNFAVVVPQGTEKVDERITGDEVQSIIEGKSMAHFLVEMTYEDIFCEEGERRIFSAEYSSLCLGEGKVWILNDGMANIT